MDNGQSIVKKGQVESVEDTADGLRIKIRLKQDGTTPLSEIPYSFPLLPKAFQSVPKVGEGAFVITTMSGNKESQRYYVGPIISQPQYNEKCDYNYGRGVATSIIDGGNLEPLGKLSNYSETFGSFPKTNDVAIVGRGSQDIIMHENENTGSNELDIRCGIRQNSPDGQDKDVVGKVVFNKSDPAYVQLKYKNNLTTNKDQEGNSMVNIVADKINIISNKDENGLDLTDSEQLIKEDSIDEMMEKLHQLPHGDTLVTLLKLIINTIITHVHAYAGIPPSIAGYTKELTLFDVDSILSKHVRVS